MFKIFALVSFVLVSLSIFAIDNHSQKASYQLVFNSIWSTKTHPKNFPYSAHFSPLIGLTHKKDFHLWQLGGMASNGVKQTAEDGNNTKIKGAIQYAIQQQYGQYLIQASGIDSPDSVKLTFDVTINYHHLSLISMLAPSADWFVGIDAHPLYDTKTGWIQSKKIDLIVYDASTKKDNIVFSYYTQPQQPKKTIALASHIDSDFKNGQPIVGQFILRRLYQ